jgi:hypothetical protein
MFDNAENVFYHSVTMSEIAHSLLCYLSRKKLFCRIPTITL